MSIAGGGRLEGLFVVTEISRAAQGHARHVLAGRIEPVAGNFQDDHDAVELSRLPAAFEQVSGRRLVGPKERGPQQRGR